MEPSHDHAIPPRRAPEHLELSRSLARSPHMYIRTLTPLVVALVIACASAGSSAYPLSGVDVAPVLRGCSGYTEGPERGYNVAVEFVVDASGRVERHTIKAQPRRHPAGRPHRPEMTQRAIEHATGCFFTAALIDGRPVPVKMTKRFFYPGEG
jgi:hypothetical protein